MFLRRNKFQVRSGVLCHVGSDGFSTVCVEVGKVLCERFLALGCFSQAGLHVPQTLQRSDVNVMHSGTTPMERVAFRDGRSVHGIQTPGYHPGGCVREKNSELDLNYASLSRPHKLSGAINSVSKAETFSTIPLGASHAGEERP